MTVKIRVSYEKDQERDRVLRVLRPVLAGAKIKDQADKVPHRLIYIELGKIVGEDDP